MEVSQRVTLSFQRETTKYVKNEMELTLSRFGSPEVPFIFIADVYCRHCKHTRFVNLSLNKRRQQKTNANIGATKLFSAVAFRF
jgi:hypothetical protein